MPTENDRTLRDEYFNISSIFNYQGPTPEVRTRWLEIWRTSIETDTCGLVDVEVVGLYACLGWRIAAIDGSFDQAGKCLEHYFQHPNIAKADLSNWAEITCFRAVS